MHADSLARRWEALLWALPLLAASVAALPVVVSGFPQGHDWIFELVRSAQYTQAVRAGQWPPTWASELYAGYGSPIFLFYAPLFPAASALGSALLGTVGGGCVAALALLQAGKQYQPNVDRAIDFILARVEASPVDGLAITDSRGTQIQRKLGPYIDT